jgi:nucleoside-diphosphate-sugar epimerase
MPTETKKIFVTGANGFVGRNLVHRLLNSGFIVRGLILPGEDPFEEHDNLRWRVGDVTDSQGMRDAMQGCDQVVHLAGIVANPSHETNQRVNTVATAKILKLAEDLDYDRFIFMSAAAAKFTEPNAYGISKKMAEDIVSASALEWAVLRTPLIIGDGSEEFERFVEFVEKIPFVVPIFGLGNVIKRPVFIDDVIDALAALVTSTKIDKKIYEVACDEKVTLDQLVDSVLEFKGLKKQKVHIPVSISLAMAAVAEALLGNRSPITRDIVKGLNEDIIFDTDVVIANEQLKLHTLSQSLEKLK